MLFLYNNLIMDYSENTCYLKVVRPPTKSIKHCATGATQVQRVSFQNNHELLEYSIRHSKMLAQYLEKYPFSIKYNNKQAEELMKIKGIMDEKAKFYVSKTLRQLHCTLYASFLINEVKKRKYDSKNQFHEEKLMMIWENLKPFEKLQARVSKQWISIGFQVEDPSTDFRGAGQLGLINLYKFSKSPKCHKVFQIATDPKTQYFFASAGLYLTMMASQMLQKHRFGYSFIQSSQTDDILTQFQKIYDMLFCEFSKFWIQKCPNKSIMYFNQNLKNFSLIIDQWNTKLLISRVHDISNQK